LEHGGWSFGPNSHFFFDSREWNGHRRGHDRTDDGPQTSRDLAWGGGDLLGVDIPADVQYVQATGPAKLTVTGSRDVVADVVVDRGRIDFAHDRGHWSNLTIVLSAPGVNRFEMTGSGKLDISGYRQDRLTLDLSGNSQVTVKGEARTLDLQMSGSAESDLSGLKLKDATVAIDGAGDATIAPTDSAKVDISGSGEVTLLTNPARLESNISGSGEIHHGAPVDTHPATPAGPKTRT
ncbi:MAG TPA: DUF2807 domain-containing protein, partial [Phenylobacterium sp.]|nr:DUF2807 domain-containing protein [Phenylobacterium sp.]